MKKWIIGLALLMGTMSLSAQTKNKKYDLFYVESNTVVGSVIYPTGVFLRNDTLFIEVNSLANVVNIHNEDSTWHPLLLRPFREPRAKDTTIVSPRGEGKLKRVLVSSDTTHGKSTIKQ